MLGGIDLAASTGLEIGPLHAPLVRRTESNIRYVDYASTEVLRASFRHPNADPCDIVDVDIVWGERPLGDCIAEPVDFVLASHVIEHVPDLIGWLLEVRGALRPGGILGLAAPDRRHTFDLRRPVSTPGEMVEAYLRRHRAPSLHQIFDAAALSKDTEDAAEWRLGKSYRGVPAEVMRRLPDALDMVRALATEPRYIDAHCWVFTPESFLDSLEMLSRLGLLPYTVDAFFPTEPGSIEFQVRLRADDAGAPAIAQSIATVRDGLTAVERTDDAPPADTGVAAVLTENATLRAELDAIRRSTSWRLTAPLRSVVDAVRPTRPGRG